MATDVLKTQSRGSGLSRGELMKERKNGRIPAVFFGDKIESTPIFVNQVEFGHIFSEKGKIFEIQIGGKKKLVNAKTITYDPLKKFIYHIDFYALKKGVETTVKVPVKLVGEAKGQKAGGNVQLKRQTLEITGTPMNIPEEIEVDVSELDIGESLRVSDLKIKGDYRIDDEGELTVAMVAAPKKAEEEAPKAESEESATEAQADSTEEKE